MTESIVYQGQAIIDDKTDNSSTTITPYGFSKIDGYIAYIEIDSLSQDIPKKDYKNLELRFCEADIHEEKDYSTENNIVLKVQDVFKPNHVSLDYIALICIIE